MHGMPPKYSATETTGGSRRQDGSNVRRVPQVKCRASRRRFARGNFRAIDRRRTQTIASQSRRAHNVQRVP